MDNGKRRALFFNTDKWKLNRCLAPGNLCTNQAIRSHSVQNSKVLELLACEGHVKGIKYNVEKDSSMSVKFEDIGRNRASTFEGFCSEHDQSLFHLIDTNTFDPGNQEHLFLTAYRSVAREVHAVMEGAAKLQFAYQGRISLGLDTGSVPEPAGMQAISNFINAYASWEYKEKLDDALLARDFASLLHKTVFLNHRQPSLAVSSCFTLEDRPNEEEDIRVTLNIFPVSVESSVALFSFTPGDSERVREFMQPLLDSGAEYQKYLVSKLVLTHCENFYLSPAVYGSWPIEKVQVIESFFSETLRHNVDAESEHLYLF